MKKKFNLDKIKVLKQALPYAFRYKKYFIPYIIISTILCALGAVVPMMSAQQLLKLTDGLLNQLLSLSILILGMQIFMNALRYFARTNAHKFFHNVLKEIQIDLADEVLKIKTKDLDKNSSGVFIDRLTQDTSKIADIFIELNYSIMDIITNIGLLFAIFIINKVMFLYFIVAITLVFIIERIRIKKRIAIDKKRREMAEKATGLIGELVRGIRDIKVLNAQDSFMNKVNTEITKVNDERYKMSTVNRRYTFLANTVDDILEFLLILLAVVMISAGKLTIANFVIIYMYRDRVFSFLYIVSSLIESFKDFELSASRVFAIIDGIGFDKEEFGTTHLDKVNGDFEFKNVSFSYNKKKKVLKNISFKVKRNQTIGFVGKSGSGKSTIFSLLAKLYDVNEGEILIDGVNLNELDRDSIRGNISIITQNPYIFNASIKENLTLVKEGLTDKDIVKACKIACLHDFIMTLPDGYDTLVGEGGMTLSGGQRQRLAIARALVQNTEIILFDEATSALDNETQESIQKAINNMKNKYTILIIAHRLSTVINSDNIFVINNGKVEDSGTHEELLEKNKYYKKLYNLELSKSS